MGGDSFLVVQPGAEADEADEADEDGVVGVVREVSVPAVDCVEQVDDVVDFVGRPLISLWNTALFLWIALGCGAGR